jgi:hypothetical protein
MTKFDKKFGIKEVADVAFYPVSFLNDKKERIAGLEVAEDGTITANIDPVLTFETLKVSTLEMTAEQTEARGGKGNAPLIIWDYGREVNVTLEDALMSVDCLQKLFGDDEAKGNVITINAGKFPGTYSIVGQTYARDDEGTDHLFTFYIPKAKIQSENTITMEAEGDPTVFNMSLRVLRGEGGDMVKFILNPNIDTGTTPEIKFPEVTPAPVKPEEEEE